MAYTTYTADDLFPIPQLEEVGVPLLRKIWEQIKEDERAWNQGDWVHGIDLDEAVVDYIIDNQVPPWNCGTAYCIAGHVALAKGWKLPQTVVDNLAVGRDEYHFNTPTLVHPETGGYSDVAIIARQYLPGVDWPTLFGGSNTAEDIEAMITAMETYGADIPLSDVLDCVFHGITWAPGRY